MSKRKSRTGARGATPSGVPWSRRGVWTGAGAAIAAILLLGAAIWWRSGAGVDPSTPPLQAASLTYVGSATCAECHKQQTAEWQPSQHALAMAEPTEATVAGRFDNASITYAGVTSTFFRRDGRFMVRTDGPDGQLADFEIRYTFGVEPLQQYLIALPGGRLQALSIAWDARPASDGGQRWFHLYPNDAIKAGDPLHWTGRMQNWNFMCADCHSTNLRKGYDAATRTFNTTWSDINVGCEACHGPGAEHVRRARAGEGRTGAGFGLTARLDERRGVTWRFDQAAGVPVRSHARVTTREIDACARCHSRRAHMTEQWTPGDPFENGFRPSLVEPVLFHADGQQRDEVYNYTSFLQSRMYAKGVTCGDCHNPHTGKLRLQGNATCTLCHQDVRYDAPQHHFHPSGSPGASCAACHMPTETYMQVDPRHDHSFHVPRPDLSASLGVPNACTGCHTNRTPQWAAAEIQRRTGRAPRGSSVMAETFTAAERGAPGAGPSLDRLAADAAQPAVVRASALVRLAAGSFASTRPLEPMLRDSDPMVRRAALQVLRGRDEGTRVRLATAALTDPIRSVRIEAASTLLDVADRMLGPGDRSLFERAYDELIAEHRLHADRPEAQANLGTTLMARGRTAEAIAAFREAITLDPSFVAGHVNLADALRVTGDDASASEVLRRAVSLHPESADVHHALGLALVRQRQMDAAMEHLERAVRLDPASARYSYVHAVALHDRGERARALAVLRAALKQHPADYDTLQVLALYSQEAGDLASAREYTRRLGELRPGDPAVRELEQRLMPETRPEGR
jgi:tetratricopeptide (TPR) repeat protein